MSDYEYGKPGNEAQDKEQKAHDVKMAKELDAILKEAKDKGVTIPANVTNTDSIRWYIDEANRAESRQPKKAEKKADKK